MISRVKVTVLKTFTKQDVFGDDIPKSLNGRGSCPRHNEGEEFILEGDNCPPEFCGWAFNDIFRDYNHLRKNGDYPWMGEKGVTFSSCTDGRKPVVFKLERIE
jgi:uncharacterized repeat protein (TIGR04076 family)